MKLKVGDKIRVVGFVMLKGLDDGKTYRVSKVSQYGGSDTYTLYNVRSRKPLSNSVRHFAHDVDAWVESNISEWNRIEKLPG